MSTIVLGSLLCAAVFALVRSRLRTARLTELLEEGEAQIDAAVQDDMLISPRLTVAPHDKGASNQ